MKIGNITSINYNQLKVRISSEIHGGSVNVRGDIYYFGNIGCYLKTSNTLGETIICEVISIYDTDIDKKGDAFNIQSNRELFLKPLGTIRQIEVIKEDGKIRQVDEFILGVGIFPAIYSSVSIVTFEDMETILGIEKSDESENVKKKGGDNIVHDSFDIGTSKNLINYLIKINIDNFFNIHTAVLGNSGSGKSNTIAHIIQQIHEKRDHSALGSKIIIFDVNGEYKQAFTKNSNPKLDIKYYEPNAEGNGDDIEPFFMPYFLLNLEEWSAFLIATEATQRPFWAKVLKESRIISEICSLEKGGEKALANYFLYRLCGMIDDIFTQASTDTEACGASKSIINKIKDMVATDPFFKDILTEQLLGEINFHYLESRPGEKELEVRTVVLTNQSINCIINSLLKATQVTFGTNKDVLQDTVTEIKGNTSIIKTREAVNDKKFLSGEYFNYEFLKFAAEMILAEEDSHGNTQIRNWTSTMLTRLDYFLENKDCSFMRYPEAGQPYPPIAPNPDPLEAGEAYLKEFFDITNVEGHDANQLIIIDTSGLGPDALETLTSVVSRLIFDYRKKLKNDDRTRHPIHLILDEAHRYIKKDQKHLLKENIFEKIAREGRKYSFYLMISSQRPSEVSETVLSQCANFIVHKIQNEKDMNHIKAILPYFSDDFTHKIKQSVPGEALIFGKCVPMPLHVKVELANPEPNSKNCKIAEEWFIKENTSESQPTPTEDAPIIRQSST